jgi:aldehyde dehydrogenase (NAD+)
MPVDERISLMEKLLQIYVDRYDEMAVAISIEMGAPISFATAAQADTGRGHINSAIEALKQFEFERQVGNTRIVKEAIGVCGFITPWNWPINQISCKVAPALATGCTMVLKPSEIAPISGYLFTEMMDQAGFPAGVYNMVNGDGPNVGAVIAGHSEVDMVSFTGSTRAGILVAKAAADTVKRVTQELGGKSPNIIFEDADLESAVTAGVNHMMGNTGQSCNAPSRMLVHSSVYDKAVAIAKEAAGNVAVDQPTKEGQHLGPLSSRVQFDKVQGLIEKGIEEGATLIAGGPGKPEGLETGYFVRPTVFANVTNEMTIAQEEIFGPVLSMIPFETEEQAIQIANDTPYGLAAYFSTTSEERAARVASQLRAGMVSVNSASQDYTAPFGGYKQSGNGREWGEFGFDDFLEIKGITV